MPQVLSTRTPEETAALGRRLAKALRPLAVICLFGEYNENNYSYSSCSSLSASVSTIGSSIVSAIDLIIYFSQFRIGRNRWIGSGGVY